ncbi:MAG: MinD/ParA family protein [Comamonas sp.]
MNDVLLPPHTTTQNTVPGSDVRAVHRGGAQIIAVTSGKGGVGKTFLTANLASSLTRHGLRVLVLDADFGLANLDVVLNLNPKVTLHDVFIGKAQLKDAIISTTGGFDALLAGSGTADYSRLTPELRNHLIEVLEALSPRYDLILLDTGAGISDIVLFTVSLAHEVMLVATLEPTSLTDAYAAIKILATQQQRQNIRLLVNQTARPGDGQAITGQLQQVLNRFVTTHSGQPLRLIHMGDIPVDQSVKDAVMRRQLLVKTMPGSAAALAVSQLAHRLKSVLVRD